jgi:hypothetical protein
MAVHGPILTVSPGPDQQNRIDPNHMTDHEHAVTEYHAQFRRIVVRTLILFACAALLLAAGRVLHDWQPSRRAIPLVTGDVLYYRAATFGTHHVPPGLPGIVRRLPTPLRTQIGRALRIGPAPGQHITPEPRLVLWFDDTHPSITNRTAPVPIEWMLADQHGRTAGPKTRTWLQPGGPRLTYVEFPASPRRDRFLQLHAFAQGATPNPIPAGHTIFLNPYRATVSDWESDPLPLTHTNGAVECTLFTLVTGVGPNTQWTFEPKDRFALSGQPADPGAEPQTCALFSFREPENPRAPWTVAGVRLRDATGNNIVANSTSVSQASEFLLLAFSPSLWPDETWQLEVQGKRTANATFNKDEIVEFRALPLPPQGHIQPIDRVIHRGNLELRLQELENRPPLADPSYHHHSDLPAASLSVSNLDPDQFVDLVEVTDDQGRILKPGGWSRTHDEPVTFRFAIRAIPEGAQTLNIRLAVHRGRSFLFQVRPELCPAEGWSFRLPDLPPVSQD